LRCVERERLWTLPNVVSLSRLGLAVLFVMTQSVAWRLALVGIASSTDYIDGWLARRRGGPSRWGNLIDPISDRAFALAAIATLTVEDFVSPLEAFVFLSRDLATGLGFLAAQRMTALKGVRFVARFPGKVVTVVQFLVLVIAIAAPKRLTALVVVLAVVSAIAIVDYTWALWSARKR
jgi:CDP-diacylglycerol---glycerol-3-phosphate 3-phosphatidyltransferase